MSVKIIDRIVLPEVAVKTYKCCTCKEFKSEGNFRYHPKMTPYPECVDCEFSFDGDHWFVEDSNDFRPLDDL
jgi:hypothetical protein